MYIIIYNFTVNPAYLLVNDLSDTRKLDGQMSLLLLLKGVQIPPKRKKWWKYITRSIRQIGTLLRLNNIYYHLQYTNIINFNTIISDTKKENI